MVQVPTDSNMAAINTKPLGGQRTRCGLEAVKKSNEWKFWFVIIVLNLIGFAAVIFVPFKIYDDFETSYSSEVGSNRFKFDYLETKIKRVEKQIETLESKIGDCEEDEHQIDLRRRIHCGWIDFQWRLCREGHQNTQAIPSYDIT